MLMKDDIIKGFVEVFVEIFPDVQDFVPTVERPKDDSLGDVAIPLFNVAKSLRQASSVIATKIVQAFLSRHPHVNMQAVGAYVNIFLDRESNTERTLKAVNIHYGETNVLANQKIMIEFSGPNTNKPLHLGHMRNNALGESVSRLLVAAGADVFKVNIVNDRGVHICKSMLAYKIFAEGATPASVGQKSDHFVGDYYVKYSQWSATNPEAEAMIIAMLNEWEDGHVETRALWRMMNDWAIDGIRETYERTGISFDKIYYESETYMSGQDLVKKGLVDGVFYQDLDGSIRLDVSEITPSSKEEEVIPSKVFLRADGTSVYITQDVGTAVQRHLDFPFDRLIYVVAHEQKRHFEILFYALKKLGYQWADSLYHLSYGMVNLTSGKMKSREGTVVDADKLLDDLEAMVVEEINLKGRASEVEPRTAFNVALGAIHYFLLQIAPAKDMLFDPVASLSFNGNTGPYLQYAYARIAAMLRRPAAVALESHTIDYALLIHDEEWRLTKLVGDFPQVMQKAALDYNPSLLAMFIYDLAKTFNKYYHDVVILSDEKHELVASRLHLCRCVGHVLRKGLEVLAIPVLEKM
jgi:arginyl-tRNA synthetase